MSKADYYIVDGDVHREMVQELQLYPEIDEFDPMGDSLDWLPNEKDFFMFILGLSGLQVSSIANTLKEARSKRLKPLFQKIDIQLSKTNWQYMDTANRFIDDFYTLGKRKVWKDLEVPTIFDAADNHAKYFLKRYNFDQILNLSDDLKTNVRRTIWEGVAKGQSMSQIANNLQKTAIDSPLSVTSKRTGKIIRHISAKQRAMMIARTETMRAVNQSAIIGYIQHGITLFNVNTAHDRRVCVLCADNEHRNPYSLANLPYLPVHPYCRCTYSASLDGILNPDYTVISQYPNLVTEGFEAVIEPDILAFY